MCHFAGDWCVSTNAQAACRTENEADKDGRNVYMCIQETESGPDRLLNLQLGTGEK